MTMGTWKRRQIEKKNKGKQETGKSKGLCPDPLQRYLCRSNRSYKHPAYATVMGIKPSTDQSGNNGILPRKKSK